MRSSLCLSDVLRSCLGLPESLCGGVFAPIPVPTLGASGGCTLDAPFLVIFALRTSKAAPAVAVESAVLTEGAGYMRARSMRKVSSIQTLAFHGRAGIIRPPPARCSCVGSITGTSRFEIVADGDVPNSLFKQILQLEQLAVCFLHSLLLLFIRTRERIICTRVTCRTFYRNSEHLKMSVFKVRNKANLGDYYAVRAWRVLPMKVCEAGKALNLRQIHLISPTQRGGQKTTRRVMRNISTSTLQVAARCRIKVPLQNISVPECAFTSTFLQNTAGTRARNVPFTHRREELRVAKYMNSRQTLILWQELQPKLRGIQIRRDMGQEPETGAKS